ncbi:hypothetical protein GALL_280970 [mine drainage metagenome]|uniref:Uncharacterized protein n=1 Tax=mine drainage metagenome TaxID=410659 RepID=A0A1J5RDB9_9ZZZZ
MAPRFKLKASSDRATESPRWHPNFRNYERLPDIKAVRTVFFVNALAISVAVALLAYVVFREYSIHTIRNQIALADQDIARNRVLSEHGVRLFREFQQEQKKVDVVSAYLHSRPTLSPVVIHIAQTLPKNIALTYVEMRDSGMILRGVVRGAPELASGIASAYVDQLHADRALATEFGNVDLTNLNKNPQDGRLNFELFLKLKMPKK